MAFGSANLLNQRGLPTMMQKAEAFLVGVILATTVAALSIGDFNPPHISLATKVHNDSTNSTNPNMPWAIVDKETNEVICAKSFEICQAGLDAIKKGFWSPFRPDAPISCKPKPDCFPPESNCIKGFNCQKAN
jgi:hypothetical protein